MSIQRARKHLASLYAVLPLCMLILLTTFSAQAKTSVNLPSFSGEEIFEGIFFAHGKVAKAIPEIKEKVDLKEWVTRDELKNFTKLRKQSVRLIKQNHPTFFIQFKKNIQSGNHILIKQEMQSAGKILMETLSEITGVEDREIASMERKFKTSYNSARNQSKEGMKEEAKKIIAEAKLEYGNQRSTDRSACVVVALAVVVAVVAIFVIATVALIPSYRSNSQDELKMDKLIHSIATNLSV